MKKTINAVINGISEKLEKFISHADNKFDLAGDMFNKLQNQIKALNAKNQKRADAIKTLDDRVSAVKALLAEDYDNKIKELEQKANRTGQFHLDAVNEKFAGVTDDLGYEANQRTKVHNRLCKVEKKIEELEKYPLKASNVISKKLNDKIDEKIDNNARLLQDATRKIFVNIDAINEDIDEVAEEAKEDINEVNFRITKLERNIPNIDSIHERIDDCEQDINNVELNIPDINQPTDQTKALKEDYDILEGKYWQLRSELNSIYKVLEMDALDIQDLYNKLETHPKKSNHAVFIDAVSFDNGEEVNNAK